MNRSQGHEVPFEHSLVPLLPCLFVGVGVG